MRYNEDDFSLLENRTGVINKAEIKLKVEYIGGYWMILNLDIGDYIAKSNIRGESHKVYWYVIAHLHYGNTFPNSKRVAAALGMKPGNVRRAFIELERIHAIVKDDNVSMVNPRFAWRGRRSEQMATVKRLEDKGINL